METVQKVSVSEQEERLVFAMNILGDKTRYKMFKLLTGNQELCVSEIADQLGISVSAVSQHFKNFEMTGLVEKNRYGQKICYGLKDEAFVDNIKKVVESNI